MIAQERKIKILYILGSGRSGSTILDLVLGECDGFFSGGELMHMWSLGFLAGRRCGCGQELGVCDFWREVVPDRDRRAARHVVELQKKVVRGWNLALLPLPGTKAAEGLYRSRLETLYQGIAHASGCRVVIDSSKKPGHAAVAIEIGSAEAYFIHLVRDPRRVSAAWKKTQASLGSPSVRDRVQLSTAISSLGWVTRNLAVERLLRQVPSERWIRIRYEDFVAKPRETVLAVLDLVGEHASPPFVSERRVALGGNHTASGNSGRFQRGSIEIAARSEDSSPRPGLASTVLRPMLRRFGY